MRFLNTRTLQFVEYPVDLPEDYAVLSHTWGPDEISYREMSSPLPYGYLESRVGGRKILSFCQIAAHKDYGLAWIDTCCINKESDAEVTESINTMYSLYAKSSKCLAYMSDVEPAATNTYDAPYPDIIDLYRASFLASRWHKRGWTLQELVAPGTLEFYDKNWFCFGTRANIRYLAARASGIPTMFMTSPHLATMAQRLSWAAERETSRPEDKVYCLLGLLEVHIPLIYGEGYRNAWRRLQNAVLEVTEDQSLLAWEAYNLGEEYSYTGALTNSIYNYRACVNMFKISGPSDESFTMTKRGLQMSGFKGYFQPVDDPAHDKVKEKMLQAGLNPKKGILLVPLNCQTGSSQDTMQRMCLILQHISSDRYFRVECQRLESAIDPKSLIDLPNFCIPRDGVYATHYQPLEFLPIIPNEKYNSYFSVWKFTSEKRKAIEATPNSPVQTLALTKGMHREISKFLISVYKNETTQIGPSQLASFRNHLLSRF